MAQRTSFLNPSLCELGENIILPFPNSGLMLKTFVDLESLWEERIVSLTLIQLLILGGVYGGSAP